MLKCKCKELCKCTCLISLYCFKLAFYSLISKLEKMEVPKTNKKRKITFVVQLLLYPQDLCQNLWFVMITSTCEKIIRYEWEKMQLI